MLKKTFLVVILITTILLAGCSTSVSTSQTPLTSTTVSGSTSPTANPTSTTAPANISLKIGSLPRIYDIIAYAAQQEGIFQKHQLSVEIVSFRSQVEKDNGMLSGNLDGVIEGTYGAVNLNKEAQTSKLIGHNFMAHMFNLIVSPGSGISNPSQLKGKEIATSTGTIMDYALDKMLTAEGMSLKDVITTNVPNMPLRLEMLAQNKLPAAMFTAPLSDQAIAIGNILLLDDSKEQFGGPGLIFSSEALKNKPEGIERFVQSWQEAVKMINSNPEKYRSLVVSTAKVPEAIAATYKIPEFPELRLPSEAEINTIVTWMKEKGMITQDIAYSNIVDSRFIK
jgi:NitT/TauT family transport system substrate-binding protein